MARPRCGFSCTICGEALDLPRSREAPSLPPVVRVRGFSSGKRRGDDNYGGAVRGLDGVAEEKVGLTMRWDGEVDDEGCDVGVPGYA